MLINIKKYFTNNKKIDDKEYFYDRYNYLTQDTSTLEYSFVLSICLIIVAIHQINFNRYDNLFITMYIYISLVLYLTIIIGHLQYISDKKLDEKIFLLNNPNLTMFAIDRLKCKKIFNIDNNAVRLLFSLSKHQMYK